MIGFPIAAEALDGAEPSLAPLPPVFSRTIVAALLVGANLPFFGNVVGNIIGFIKDLGANGLVGLLALGFIFWLFSHREVA